MEEEREPQEIEKIAKPKGVTSRKRLISNVILLALLTAVVVVLFLSFGELDNIGKTIAEVADGDNFKWLIFAGLVTLGFFFLYPIPLVILSKSYDKKLPAVDSFLIGAGEHFYNGVTPFAAGGQPIQMYDFAKKGMRAGVATGIVLSNFLIYLTVLNTYEVCAFIYWGDFNDALLAFSHGSEVGYAWLLVAVIMGYVFNLGFVVFLYFLGLSKRLSNWLVKMAKLVCRIKIVGKFLSPKIPEFEEYCNNVQSVTKSMFSRKGHVALAFLVKGVVYALYFSIPYFIMRAVGIEFSSIWAFPKTGLATAFASAAVCWIPTPGGTGGIEYAFSIVLGAVAPNVPFGAAQAVSLLWRMFSFYLVLILSLVAVLIFEGRFNLEYSKKKKAAAAASIDGQSVGLPQEQVPEESGDGDK